MDAGAIAWKEKGNVYYRQKQFKEALRCYSEAVQIDPQYADAWYNLGMTCRTLGYSVEAVTCFERAKNCSDGGSSGYPAVLHGSFQSSPEPSNPTWDNSTVAMKESAGWGKSAGKKKQLLKRLAPVIVLILALVVCIMAILPLATGTNGSGLFSFPGIHGTDSPASKGQQGQVIAKTPDTGSAIVPDGIQDPVDIPKKFQAMKTGAVLKSFPYVVRGERGEVNLTMYEGAASEIAKEDPYSYVGEKDRYQKFIDLPVQDAFLDPLVEAIREKTRDSDDQVRIAVSLVQQIPYDQEMLDQGTLEIRYPYQTLLDNKGVCCEKSVLLAYILHKLGYGVALFDFENEKHTAVGIRVTPEYEYKNTGYAFIETTTPLIISDGNGDYPAFGRIRSFPEVLPAGEGKVFSSVHEEWNDSREWDRLNSQGPVLDRVDYSSWQSLCRKYGIVPVTG
jgi:hypothetical protein